MKTIIFFSLLLLLIVGTSGSWDTLIRGLPIVGGLAGEGVSAPLSGGSSGALPQATASPDGNVGVSF
ncbi:hypothetical protein QR680_015726 [Steinernema hermaphroditum]|uniref:Secreted protein n=1 Tax=Steinernema hermaphroditum TaxID=289476 RepID=A0AA39LKQ7_9BILA|nr:hypothetical protein QR680_015726 [Steinernema hermaphroditum]